MYFGYFIYIMEKKMKLLISYGRYTLKTMLILAALGAFSSSAFAITVHEDFEGIGGFLDQGQGVSNFDVGTANFSGGMSGIAKIGELYKSGRHAWMVKGGETGTIQFGMNTTEVSFYAKAFSGADGSSVVTAFDKAGNTLQSLILEAANPFTKFTVSGLVYRITFVNNDSDNTRMNSLDDFSVTTVPIPAAFWLFGAAILGVMRFSRKDTLV